jgi:hypothetical protein
LKSVHIVVFFELVVALLHLGLQFAYFKDRGTVIMSEGEDADRFYVILSGRVRVSQSAAGKRAMNQAVRRAQAEQKMKRSHDDPHAALLASNHHHYGKCGFVWCDLNDSISKSVTTTW